MVEAEIVKVGRTPRVAGSRITVYDILDYKQAGWGRDEIAALFDLSSRQVDAAVRYIEEHQDEVMAEYEAILARCEGEPTRAWRKARRCARATASHAPRATTVGRPGVPG